MDGTQAIGLKKLCIGVATATIVSGCLGGGDGDESVSAMPDYADVRLSGSVGDGPIVGATLTVLAEDGAVLASFESSDFAGYDVTVRTRPRNFPLTIEARGGTDLVTDAAPDFFLETVVARPSKRKVANINPYTTIAAELARNLPGGMSRSNIEKAESIVVTRLNFGLNSLVDTGPTSTEINDGNVAEIVSASEALGELIRRTRDAMSAAGTPVTGDDVLQAIGSDLTDEVLDGQGGPRADARIAAVASVASAQIALETMANELHVNGVDGTPAMAAAIRQVSGASPQSLDELTSTVQMLYQARIGLAAAASASGDAGLEALLDTALSLRPGQDASLVRSLLPGSYRSALGASVTAVAGGGDSLVQDVNAVVRVGDPDPGINQPPTINGSPEATVRANGTYYFLPTAFDPDGDTLSFSANGLPGWASIDAASGEISGTPGEAEVGDYTGITITVSDGVASATLGPFAIAVTPTPVINSPPGIGGTPADTVTVGSDYSFTPSASDADGDTLTFSVENLPSWASFDASTGRVSGTPGDADVGAYNGIRITVSDGTDSAVLGPFSISVEAVGLGSVTLNWAPPTQNEDGTVLTDLAGYRIYWGTTPGQYPNSVTIDNPGVTTYVIDNLGPGTYQFVATSINSAGIESDYSNPATKTVP